jgi:hypothetical protein
LILGEDILKSDGMFGDYEELFATWISYDMAYDGYFYARYMPYFSFRFNYPWAKITLNIQLLASSSSL